MQELKQIGLKLFYTILKTHKQKLPKELKEMGLESFINLLLGNQFAKEEFRAAHAKADEKQYVEFLTRWAEYVSEMQEGKGQKLGRNLTIDEEKFLNEDQKKVLNNMRSQILK